MRVGCVEVGIALALAGCHLVFPLPDPPSDAGPRVTGTLFKRWVENDANGRPLSHEDRFPVAQLSAIAVMPDGTRAPVTFATDGSFSFHVPAADTRYRLVLSIDGAVQEIQHDAAHLALAVR